MRKPEMTARQFNNHNREKLRKVLREKSPAASLRVTRDDSQERADQVVRRLSDPKASCR